MIYSGVGSRFGVPPKIEILMVDLGAVFAENGFILRSGFAKTSDIAFQEGHEKVRIDNMEIYLPYEGFNRSKTQHLKNKGFLVTDENILKDAQQIASTLHPKWKSLDEYEKKFHTRNVFQVLGKTLDIQSDFVVCYTPDGAETTKETSIKTGGTATCIRLGDRLEIPVFNLKRPDALDRLDKFLENYNGN